ncbi:hypothetical protein GCM10022197_06060 [Microlunatus spumicola]|uniref:DUF222 domain-containing protein n=1 Tax=Microlunatus spumicola TaxID=81499 RepID=A0ABP6WNU6_9ACTN
MENEVELRRRECEVLVLAAAWADVHDLDTTATGYEPLVERAVGYGGDGCPETSEYAVHELGALRGTSSGTAEQLVADALDLRHRHPRLWDRVRAGEVRAWQAVHVARACHHLPREAAGLVDLAVARYLGQLTWGRFGRLLAAAVLQADPALTGERAEQARRSRGVWAYPGEDGLTTLVAKAAAGDVVCLLATVNRLADVLETEGDTAPADERRAKALGLLAQPARALHLLIAHEHDEDPHGPAVPDDDGHQDDEGGSRRGGLDLVAPGGLTRERDLLPRVVLHFHLSSAALALGHGVARPEHGEPTSLDQLRSWLAETGCPVTVRPLLDPAATAAVDAYETPVRMREALFARNPAEVFPFGAAVRRTLDSDHSVPYVPLERGGPPGQTGLHNLGPLSRPHHRAVTHGRWRRRQPEPGTYVFRTPHGHVFVVTNQGTLTLGCGSFAADVWRRARQEPTSEQAAA